MHARPFHQALRVHLNDEFGEARRGLRAAFELLEEGGRLGIITWKHSECALVIDVFRELAVEAPDEASAAPKIPV